MSAAARAEGDPQGEEETRSRINTGVFYDHLTPYICPRCGQKTAVGNGALSRDVGGNCLLVPRKARNTGVYRAS